MSFKANIRQSFHIKDILFTKEDMKRLSIKNKALRELIFAPTEILENANTLLHVLRRFKLLSNYIVKLKGSSKFYRTNIPRVLYLRATCKLKSFNFSTFGFGAPINTDNIIYELSKNIRQAKKLKNVQVDFSRSISLERHKIIRVMKVFSSLRLSTISLYTGDSTRYSNEHIRSIFSSLGKLQTLKSFDMDMITDIDNVSGESYQIARRSLQKLTNLRSLTFKVDEESSAINWISDMTRLMRLTILIQGAEMMPSGFRNICLNLRPLSQLEYLEAHFKPLAESKPTNDNNETDTVELLEALKQLKKLRTIVVEGYGPFNPFPLGFSLIEGQKYKFKICAQPFCWEQTIMPSSFVELYFDLKNCDVSDEYLFSVEGEIEKMENLVAFGISFEENEDLNDKSIRNLMNPFKKLKSLESFHISFERMSCVTDKMLKSISVALSNKKNLKSLSLILNQFKKIHELNFSSIIEMLNNSPYLEDLKLDFGGTSKIDPEVLNGISKAFDKLRSLREFFFIIDLSDALVFQYFVKILARLTHVSKLYLNVEFSKNFILIDDIIEGFVRMKNLKELHLGYKSIPWFKKNWDTMTRILKCGITFS